ncbi:hypothetical protein MHU86_7586 [Fragilaria crotonensis]|nr:hypothetical protein MHU86_7586 [Fragilaria crotonensis]
MEARGAVHPSGSPEQMCFYSEQNNSLPAVLSESWLTTYDGDMNRELNVGNVSNPDSAQMPGTQGCSKSEPVDSELAEQQRTKDGKDMVVVSSSLKPASYCLEESSTSKHLRLSSTSKHLRLSSNVTLKTAEELEIRQHSKNDVEGTFGANSSSRDSLAVLDVVPNFAQQDMKMVADEKKAGKVGNSPAFYDIAQERLKSDRNHMAHSNDVAADSGRALAIKKKTNIERKKVKVVEQASAISDEILLRTSLAATIHSPGNNEEEEARKTAIQTNCASCQHDFVEGAAAFT